MATIATAEVQVIADTRRFVPDLRRKLKAAFANLGNQLGDDVVKQFEARVTKRLDTIMQRAGRDSAKEFSKAFDNSLKNAGLSASLRQQLSNAGARQGAATAGKAIAEVFGDNIKGTLGRVSDDFFEDVSFQTVMTQAGRAGSDTAQAFADNFRQSIRNDMRQRIDEDLTKAFEDIENTAHIPEIFRRIGESSGESFVVGADSQFADLNEGIRLAFASSDIDTDAFFAGQRAGIQFSDGLFEPLEGRFARRMQQTLQQATQQTIPPVFQNAGQQAAQALNQGIASQQPQLSATIRSIIDADDGAADTAGRRFGQRFQRGVLRALRQLPSAFMGFINLIAIQPLTALGGVLGEMTSEMVSMIGQALAVIALLEALSGLLFALPAATGVASAGIAAMIVPLLGTKDAFSEAFGEAENFEDALGRLTAPAQDVARELRAIVPALREMQLGAQVAFFQELDGAIESVAANLQDELAQGLEDASGAFGRVVDSIAEFLAEAETAETLDRIFQTLEGTFDALAESMAPFLRGLRTLTDEFLPSIQNLNDLFATFGDRFNNWVDDVVESGAAMQAFDRAVDTLQELFDIASSIAAIFDAMFDAAESVGVDALGGIADALAAIAEGFRSTEGQELLGGVFDALSRIARVVGGVFATLFENLAELAPGVADLFEEVGPPLEDLINALADAFAKLFEDDPFADRGAIDFFRELIQALSEVNWEGAAESLNGFLGALSHFGVVLTTVIDLFIFLQSILPTIFTIAVTLMSELVDVLNGSQINDFLTSFRELVNFPSDEEIFSWITDAWDSVVESLTTPVDFTNVLDGFQELEEGWNGVVEFFTSTAQGWGEFFSGLGQAALEGMGDFLETIRTKWEEVEQGWIDFWDGLTAEATSGFTGIVDSAVAGIQTFTSTITGFIDAQLADWNTFWANLENAALIALQSIGFDVTGAFGGVRSTFSGFRTDISQGWNNLWTNLTNTARNTLNTIRSTVSNVLASIRSIISGWISGVRSLWSGFWSGLTSFVSSGLASANSAVSSALGRLRDAFSNMASRVRDILGDLRDFISGIGSSIRGIVDNIASAVSSAINAAQNLGNIDLNPFADGGIVTRPTAALIGEAGPEVVIPLSRPQRAVDLVQQSGLLSLLAAQGAVSSTTAQVDGRPIEMHVHSENSDAEQVARRAMRLLERSMGGRGLERTR